MDFQYREYTPAPWLGGDIVGPMGEFYCAVSHASPTFVEFLLNALNNAPSPTPAKEPT